jgi:hypothetical protein
MTIESGGVKKNVALIDGLGRLLSLATTQAEDREVNKRTGESWSLDFDDTIAGAGKYFLYFENTGADTYLFTDFRLIGSAATLVEIDCVSGTAADAAPQAISPLSRNTGKIPQMDVNTFYGTDITGLTDKGRFFPMQIEAANKLEHLRTTSGIIVEPGGAIALKTIGAATIQGMLSVYKVEKIE